jgi:natural product precursor
MKKLNKLQINSEKIMKNEELIALKGGYGGSNTVQVRCGFSPNYTSDCFPVSYDNWDMAAQVISTVCGGAGATFGQSCPN